MLCRPTNPSYSLSEVNIYTTMYAIEELYLNRYLIDINYYLDNILEKNKIWLASVHN